MLDIDKRYFELCNTYSDIYEHLPTLKQYGDRCDHVTEFGVRWGTSLVAWLASNAKTIRGYDINPDCTVKDLIEYAEATQRDFKFIINSTIDENLVIEETDLLFIDSCHQYLHCKKELELHVSRVKKFLIFHDTELFGIIGDDGSPGGILTAISEFLNEHSEWEIVKHYSNNNGLTVLQRI